MKQFWGSILAFTMVSSASMAHAEDVPLSKAALCNQEIARLTKDRPEWILKTERAAKNAAAAYEMALRYSQFMRNFDREDVLNNSNFANVAHGRAEAELQKWTFIIDSDGDRYEGLKAARMELEENKITYSKSVSGRSIGIFDRTLAVSSDSGFGDYRRRGAQLWLRVDGANAFDATVHLDKVTDYVRTIANHYISQNISDATETCKSDIEKLAKTQADSIFEQTLYRSSQLVQAALRTKSSRKQ